MGRFGATRDRAKHCAAYQARAAAHQQPVQREPHASGADRCGLDERLSADRGAWRSYRSSSVNSTAHFTHPGSWKAARPVRKAPSPLAMAGAMRASGADPSPDLHRAQGVVARPVPHGCGLDESAGKLGVEAVEHLDPGCWRVPFGNVMYQVVRPSARRETRLSCRTTARASSRCPRCGSWRSGSPPERAPRSWNRACAQSREPPRSTLDPSLGSGRSARSSADEPTAARHSRDADFILSG